MREEAEAIAESEWPDLQNAIREVAVDGGNDLSWGIPEFSEREKASYYADHMMNILHNHGFTAKGGSITDGILVEW